MEMKVFAAIENVIMKLSYRNLQFFPVLRTFLFACGFALQHFSLFCISLMTIPALNKEWDGAFAEKLRLSLLGVENTL